MEWISIEDKEIPENEWVLAYCKIQIDITEDDYDFAEDSPNIYTIRKNRSWYEVYSNTCGCCCREVYPINWMPLPKTPNLD